MKKVVGAKPQNILERTFDFAVRIVKLSGKLDERPGVGRIMMSQILRAGTSVPSNVEEAQAGQSKADFISKRASQKKKHKKHKNDNTNTPPRKTTTKQNSNQ